MNCQDARRLLPPYADGELDLDRNIELQQHLADCSQCTAQEKNLRSLRATISSPSLYYRAPSALRAKIELGSAPVNVARRAPSMRTLAIAASILLLIGASATIGMLLSKAGPNADMRLAEQILAAHVRSLQVAHLTDVVSSDQHTVKPWFRGKLDYSPRIPDLSEQGFTLTGGRLDYLADRSVASLVYHRRLHAINVFTWPAANDDERVVREVARQGYHMLYWQHAGMTYWAISDLNDSELHEFVRLFQADSTRLQQ